MMTRGVQALAKKLTNKKQRSQTLARELAFKACLASRFDERSVLLLTSTPRSGSTWLGGALGAIPRSCVLFEPLHPDLVPGVRTAGFSARTYVHPDDRWMEGEAFLRRVFEGKVINEWTTREMSLREAWCAATMIIKFVRANRLLPWLCRTFEVRSPVLLVRHPCAVISSQLKFPFCRHRRKHRP